MILIRLLYYLPMERMEKRTDFYDFIDKIQRQDKYIEYIEKENEKLKEFKTKREESRFYFKAQMERAEPKTAREAEDLQKAKEIFEKLYREELSCLEEENKKLKDYTDNLDSENDNQAIEIEELKKENKILKEKQKILDRENCELIDENVKLKKENEELEEYKSMYE